VTEKELGELCSVHLGNDKRPGKGVLRRDPLPETPVGKIKRKELREPFRGGSRAAGCRALTGTRCRVGVDESRG
jgi:acyl-CoA synthetase (AMP-forming)/AMP-acid ligase II